MTETMIYRFEDFELDCGQHELRRKGSPVPVGPQIFALLELLIAHSERLVSKEEINQHVWQGRIVSESVLNSRISTAREALSDSGKAQRLIKTVHGKGFRFVGKVERTKDRPSSFSSADAAPLGTDSPLPAPTPTPKEPPLRSIAVLPFDVMSGESDLVFFGDGLAEDIITVLAKIHGLFVSARTSSFFYRGGKKTTRQIGSELGVRYVLEGSVRRMGEKVRVTAQLIDTSNDRHVWAERYDRSVRDVFELQDEMTREIVSALQIKLTAGQTTRVFSAGTTNYHAWESMARATLLVTTNNRNHLETARGLLETATQIDEGYARAHTVLAMVHILFVYNGWTTDPGQSIQDARLHADLAFATDGETATHQRLLAIFSLLQRDYESAIAHSTRSRELPASYDLVTFVPGLVHLYANEFDVAIAHLESTMQSNPHYLINFPAILGFAQILARDYTTAEERTREALNMDPDYSLAHANLAILFAETDRVEEAKNAARDALATNPALRISHPGTSFLFKEPQTAERVARALRLAGLPD